MSTIGKAGCVIIPKHPGEVYADSAYRGARFRDAVEAQGGRARVVATHVWARNDAHGRAKLAGIEVKASATVKAGDFTGLRALAESCGDRFAFGVVLYDSTDAVPFGDRLAAVPLSSLWR